MAKRHSLLVATAMCVFLSLPVGAKADGTYSAPAPVSSSSCWTGPFNGFYVGANLGWGWADADQLTKGFEASGDDSGFTAGIVSGYNLQCGRFLIGYESDINWVNFETDSDYPPPDPAFLTSSIDWFSTTRARIGFVHDDKFLFYVTGGLAYAEVEHSRSDPTFSFSASDDDRETGWTVGGGIEWLRHTNWRLRAEALYVDLGTEEHTYTVTTGCGSVCTSTTEWDDSFWVARLGLTYRFGSEPEAVPLK